MSQRILEVKKRISTVPTSGSHRLQMWVETYAEIEPEVFVFQKKQPVPPNVDEYDEYTNIASAADMEEYPINAPDAQLAPFFRLSSMDLLFRSVSLLYTSLATMEADLHALINNLDHLDETGYETTLLIEGKILP